MDKILTGIRPTGNLHIGHYFGAVKNWVYFQDKYQSNFEIADVQGLTDNFNNPSKVSKNVKEITLDLLACGIDPNKSTIFIQSLIPEIAEMTIYYSNLVTVSRLFRNPTVKSEVNQKKELFGNSGESITYGFLGYPVSQAADITIFDGKYIPVGEDQLPLIEQCREIVRKFNSIYGETFIEPSPLLTENKRIKGLDGNEKMGKSLGNAIYLIDDEEVVSKKIMSAVTDPNRIKKDDKGNPNVCMVFYYHNLVNKDNIDTICSECENGQRGCVACKKELIKSMMDFLKPFQERRKYYENNEELVYKILEDGTKKARLQAIEKMKQVRKNMQIDYFEK